MQQRQETAGTGGSTPPVPAFRALWLEGIAAPVLLPEDPGLIEALCRCIHGWPSRLTSFDAGAANAPRPLCVIEAQGGGLYRASSRYVDDMLEDLHAATAICVVLADLSQAYSETRDGHLFGLHCGGVVIGGRGIVIAGAKRAGKSTLVARLSAMPEVEVLGDDVLPVAADGTAIGLGLAPRLRLPLPRTAAPAFRAHVESWLGPADDRYGYLLSPALAPHGRRVRVEAFVLLDRRSDAAASLHVMPPDDVLHALVARSITGPDGPEATFDAAQALASGLAGVRLVYSDLEEAAALIAAAFPADGRAAADAVALSPPLPAQPPLPDHRRATEIPPAAPCRRAQGVATRRMGEAAFLWQPGEAMLWHLNPVAQAIWTLLSRPRSARSVARILQEAFPDEPPQRLEDDTRALLAQLAQEGLVTLASRSGPAGRWLFDPVA